MVLLLLNTLENSHPEGTVTSVMSCDTGLDFSWGDFVFVTFIHLL